MNSTPSTKTGGRRGSGGFVLVAVLLLICVLALLAARMAAGALTEQELVSARARQVRLRASLDNGLSLARLMLTSNARADATSGQDLWAGGPVRLDLGDATVTFRIADEHARVSVPRLIRAGNPETPRELRKQLQHFVQESAKTLELEEDAIRRWFVAHQFRLDLPEEMVGRPLFTVSGSFPAGDDRRPAAGDFLTAWTDGTLNVNTARSESLELLLGERAERFIEALLSHREEEPFAHSQEIFALPGAARLLRSTPGGQLATRSRVFRVELEAVCGPSRLCEEAIVSADRPEVPVAYRRTVPDVSVEGEVREMSVSALTDAVASEAEEDRQRD